MIYKITFFNTKILGSEWDEFFKTIFSAVSKIKIRILLQERKIDFFVISDKRLDVLNNRLHPFYLTDEVLEREKELLLTNDFNRSFLWGIVNKNLIELVEKKRIDSKNLIKIEFVLRKYNILKTLPLFKLTYLRDDRLVRVNSFCFVHVNQFLEFDLSKSINSEISKVKPVLSTNSLNLNLGNDGILETKESGDKNLFSVNSYDFWRHSLILGQSGAGKSFLVKLFVENLYKYFKDEYAVVLIDPHANLDKKIKDIDLRLKIDFRENKTNLFLNIGKPILSTELTIDLFSTMLKVHENQKLARVLKYSLNLLFGVNKMSLENLKNLLTESLYRKGILKEVKDSGVLKFFETEYQELRTSHYSTAILPIVNLISELDFIKENTKKEINFIEAVNNNFLVSFPINQAELGGKVTRIVGGAIVQQVFTMMQTGLVKKKVILVVDEFSIVQTPSLVHILSEARKFNLTVMLTQQYLLQVSADILHSAFANMVNYFCFKLSRDDAEIAARNLNLEIDEYFLKNKNDPREIHELGTKLLTDLNPRYVISRIMTGDRYCLPFKAKTVNVEL